MKSLRKILTLALWTVVVVWVLLAVLLRVPAVQRWCGTTAASLAGERLHTQVTIGRVDIGWFNRVVIDDMSIADEEGCELLHASRTALTVDIVSLLKDGRIVVPSAQLFGLRGDFHEVHGATDTARMNYQFILDAIASDDTTGRRTDISIGSVVVRRGSVSYERSDMRPLNLSDISAHVIVPYLTDDSLMVVVKKLAMKEASGLDVRSLTLRARHAGSHSEVSDMTLELPRTRLNISNATLDILNKEEREGHEETDTTTSRRWAASLDLAPSEVTPADLAFIDSRLAAVTTTLLLEGRATADSNGHLSAEGLQLRSDDGGIDLAIDELWFSDTPQRTDWTLGLRRCTISEGQATALARLLQSYDVEVPAVAEHLGGITVEGRSTGTLSKVNGGACDGTAELKVATAAGNALTDIKAQGRSITATASLSDIDLGRLTGETSLGLMTADIKAAATVSAIDRQRRAKVAAAEIEAEVTKIVYNSYCYNNISAGVKLNGEDVDATLTIDDTNAEVAAELTRRGSDWTGHASLTDVRPVALHLLKAKGDDSETAAVNATIDGTSDGRQLHITVGSNMGEATIVWDDAARHGALRGLQTADITIDDSRTIAALTGLPVTVREPLTVSVSADSLSRATVSIATEDLSYDGATYSDVRIDIGGEGLTNKDITGHYTTAAHAKRTGNDGRTLELSLNSTTTLGRDKKGDIGVAVDIQPSEVLVDDTAWSVHPSHIDYADGRLTVDGFSVEHQGQHLTVSAGDSLVADLQDIDIGYVLDLVGFDAVTFDGQASGRIVARDLTGEPQAQALLTVDDFRFEHGRMGRLEATVNWDNRRRRIDITATTEDEPDAVTLIDGYVSTADNYIDLTFRPRGTHLYFLEGFCGSIMRDIEARAMTGEISLVGSLDKVNLVGSAFCSGSIGIRQLNTTYHLNNVEVKMVPNEIMFPGDTVSDDNGNTAIVTGALHHRNLRRLTYDIDIEAHDILAYDTKDYGDNTFFGTVSASGRCSIRGRSGTIDFDIEATPSRGSFIEYSAARPTAIDEQEFITWGDRRDKSRTTDTGTSDTPAPAPQQSISSDMRINFLVNATPDFELRVLMDQDSGDKIALNGTGSIKATYYNKGAFEMFGNYTVESGTYKLTIQNIMKREFLFQDGSTIAFGGDPFNAQLSLKALYTVNSVPLSDLRVGNSFSGNNVRVDCVMNITGTPTAPEVDFDMELPTVNADARQMVRSLINSEQEMNQQVIYLLTIGRFYVQDDDSENKTSQTSLAMQGILSGTVSQQINKLLSSMVSLNNWNVGANISTGDEGWNNAEYEGIISGRMFNNRLIVNGQFGYRDNANATTSFIGDFDLQYLLVPNGNLAVKVYNQTNDRYFTKSSLNTQGIGLVMKRDFSSWSELFGRHGKKASATDDDTQPAEDQNDE